MAHKRTKCKTILVFLASSAIYLTIFLFLIFNRAHSGNDSITVASEKSAAVIRKVQIFQRGGDELRFDQPWELANSTVIRNVNTLYGMQSRFIVSNFSYSPGLGNLMFQYAALRAIAEANGAHLLLPTDSLLRRAFRLDAILITEELSVDLIRSLFKDKHEYSDCCQYHPELERIFDNDETPMKLVLGYFQSFRYFHSAYASLIRNEFTFLRGVQELALENLRKARESYSGVSNNPTYVGVHVRHGNDVTWHSRNIKHGHTVATKEYLKRAFTYFRVKFDDIIFIIASDDDAWTKQNIGSEDNIYHVSSKYREVDMATLTLCNHTIMTTGTYSWWIAYLTGGITVYYKGWPKPRSQLDRMIKKSDFFPNEWIPL